MVLFVFKLVNHVQAVDDNLNGIANQVQMCASLNTTIAELRFDRVVASNSADTEKLPFKSSQLAFVSEAISIKYRHLEFNEIIILYICT